MIVSMWATGLHPCIAMIQMHFPKAIHETQAWAIEASPWSVMGKN